MTTAELLKAITLMYPQYVIELSYQKEIELNDNKYPLEKYVAAFHKKGNNRSVVERHFHIKPKQALKQMWEALKLQTTNNGKF